jgi:hypothetical protein
VNDNNRNHVHDCEMAGRIAVHLAEYEQLKNEQRQRIGVRDNFLYAALVAAGTALAAGQWLPGEVRFRILLALPPVAVALGWTYLANDVKVTQIGGYVRHHLAPALAEATGRPALGWERARLDDAGHARRKRIQLAVDLTVFGGVAAAALIGYWTLAPWQPLWFVLSLAEATGAVLLGWQLVMHADLPRRSHRYGGGRR